MLLLSAATGRSADISGTYEGRGTLVSRDPSSTAQPSFYAALSLVFDPEPTSRLHDQASRVMVKHANRLVEIEVRDEDDGVTWSRRWKEGDNMCGVETASFCGSRGGVGRRRGLSHNEAHGPAWVVGGDSSTSDTDGVRPRRPAASHLFVSSHPLNSSVADGSVMRKETKLHFVRHDGGVSALWMRL